MISKEMKKIIDERKKSLEELFVKQYEQIEVNHEKCFITSVGMIFMITALPSFEALVVEYADNLEDAKNNAYEDGDLFYINELSEFEMYEKMLMEIEQSIG